MNTSPSNPDRNPVPAIILLLLAGIITWVGAWMWLNGYSTKRSSQRICVQFHYVNGLIAHGAVFSDGVRIGTVENIVLTKPHQVRVYALINEQNVMVTSGAQFFIRSNGLVGARYLDVEMPEQPDNGIALSERSIAVGVDPINPDKLTDDLARELGTLDVAALQRSVQQLTTTAADISVLSRRLEPVAAKTIKVEQQFGNLAENLDGTTRKIEKFIKDPKGTSDLSALVLNARDAAQCADDAIGKLQSVTADTCLRSEAKEMLSTVYSTAHEIKQTASDLQQMGSDKSLRDDAKKITSDAKKMTYDARKGIETVDSMLHDPTSGGLLKSTLILTRRAFARIDLVGAQLGQILDKRAPVVQMVFARPGHLKPPTICIPRWFYSPPIPPGTPLLLPCDTRERPVGF
jgi:ABC-type transporter Mla subunit MlaD